MPRVYSLQRLWARVKYPYVIFVPSWNQRFINTTLLLLLSNDGRSPAFDSWKGYFDISIHSLFNGWYITSTTCMVITARWNISLQWRHNERDGVSNHQPHYCLLNRLLRRGSKKTSKLPVTGLCARYSPLTGEFPHKGPVTRKMFSFDYVIMSCDI